MKTKKELKQLAMDIIDDKVFGTWNMHSPRDTYSVFMVTLFMKKKDIPKDVVHVYEYMDKAGRWSVNGMPTFFSCNFLIKKEVAILHPYLNKYKKQKESFLKSG
jgi:hypothetical protein